MGPAPRNNRTRTRVQSREMRQVLAFKILALSGQKEQLEQLAELLVARVTKSYAVYTYDVAIIKLKGDLSRTQYSQMTVLRPFIIDGLYQDATNFVLICKSQYLKLLPVVSGYLYQPQLIERSRGRYT